MSLTIVYMIIHRWQTYTYFKLFNCYIYVGTMLSSGAVVYTYLWTVYIVHLAIKLFYQIKSSKIFNSDYSRKFFIAEVIIVFVIGSVPSLLIATVGPDYEIRSYISSFVLWKWWSISFVSMFPNLIAAFISHTLILLILYKLHMQ